METCDVFIVGAGVVGCAVARAVARTNPRLRVVVADKEPEPARHQSGRNSGVVHVGYNQKPGSLKARFVVEGSRRLRAFCRERGVAVTEDGILILARDPVETETLETLHARGVANGARVCLVDREGIARLEPNAAGVAALHAPEGASFDARGYVLALAAEARDSGVQFRMAAPVVAATDKGAAVEVRVAEQMISAGVFVNAAGLHADRIAALLGVGSGYRVVPFRGYYSELVPARRSLVRAHLYPCPDLNFPFLGVHLSRTFDGRVLVGPGAALALGREAYGTFSIQPRDCLEMVAHAGFRAMWRSADFQRLLRTEWRKALSPAAVAEEARRLVPALSDADLIPSRAGIRAQLVSADGHLVEDLTIEEAPRSVHVLNAVSPALTCSLPFADHVAERVLARF